MKLDFVIPASPTDEFYSQIAIFRIALDALGGAYRSARLVAVFGGPEKVPLPRIWEPHFKEIEIAWADPARFQRLGYRAQADHRFNVIRPDADIAVLCDADTLPIRPLEQRIFDAAKRGVLCGVIAHYHFPWAEGSGDVTADWQAISQHVIGSGIETPFRYSLVDAEAPGRCPFYINLGVLIGSPAPLAALNEHTQSLREATLGRLGNYFDAQVALALAVSKNALPYEALPMRYNFPNDPVADRIYPEEMASIRIIHYLRCEQYNRHEIFVSQSAFSEFLELQLFGSNLIFQDAVREITGGAYPFAS